MKPIPLGTNDEITITTTSEMGVTHLGPSPMYSTPALVGHFEGLCFRMMAPFLEANESQVGYRVDIKHLAPTTIGMKVTIKAEIKEMEGRRVVFAVEAYNETGTKIGEGIHERRAIDISRLGGRVS